MLLKSIILSGAINGFFFILLIQSKQNKSSSDNILSCWMGLIAFQLIFYYDNLSNTPRLANELSLILFSIPLLSSPVLYFYIKSVSLNGKIKLRDYWLHFLPFLVLNIMMFFTYYSKQGSVYLENGYPHFALTLPKIWSYLLLSGMGLVPGYYSFRALILLKKFEKALPDEYSFTEQISLNWLKWMVIVLLLLFISLFVMIRFGVQFGWLDYVNLFAWVGVILTFYVFFIGFFGLRQYAPKNISLTVEQVETQTQKPSYQNSGLDERRMIEIFVQLSKHMEEAKPYLQDDLSLSMLALQLQVTSNQLSQVINQQSGVNFFTFINRFRVEDVKKQLQNPAFDHYSILGIAYTCGFRSKSAFNKVFKEISGITPAEYQKSRVNSK